MSEHGAPPYKYGTASSPAGSPGSGASAPVVLAGAPAVVFTGAPAVVLTGAPAVVLAGAPAHQTLIWFNNIPKIKFPNTRSSSDTTVF